MICNLSLFALLFTTFQIYWSLGLKAFVLALFGSYSLLPNLCMMVCFLSFSSQLKWAQSGLPQLPMAKAWSSNYSSHMFLFLFLISISHLFVTMLTISLDLQHKIHVFRHNFFIIVAPSPLPINQWLNNRC